MNLIGFVLAIERKLKTYFLLIWKDKAKITKLTSAPIKLIKVKVRLFTRSTNGKVDVLTVKLVPATIALSQMAIRLSCTPVALSEQHQNIRY